MMGLNRGVAMNAAVGRVTCRECCGLIETLYRTLILFYDDGVLFLSEIDVFLRKTR
jgi:hypothetical protein